MYPFFYVTLSTNLYGIIQHMGRSIFLYSHAKSHRIKQIEIFIYIYINICSGHVVLFKV